MPDSAPAEPSAPLVLGAGIASRTRPRLGTSPRLRRRGAIGTVARSTVGFARIVASAGSSRPRVTTDALTTSSLRPPIASWTGWSIDDSPAAPSWTVRAAAAVSNDVRDMPAPPVESARPAARPTKVDALRRLLETRGMIEPTSDPDSERDAGDGAAKQPESTGPEPTPIGDRRATTAGPTTAPGELARRSRPEPASGPDRLSTVFSNDSPTPRPRPGARASTDQFRDALAAHGLIDRPSTEPRRPNRAPDDRTGARPATRPDNSQQRTAVSGRDGNTRRRRTASSRNPSAHSRSNDDGPAPRDATVAESGSVTGQGVHGITTSLPFSLLPELQPGIRRSPSEAIHLVGDNPPITTEREHDDRSSRALGTISPPVGLPDRAGQLSGPERTRGDGREPARSSPDPGRGRGVPTGVHTGPASHQHDRDLGRTTRQRLRNVGRRAGIPHSRSLVKRPATDVTERVVVARHGVAPIRSVAASTVRFADDGGRPVSVRSVDSGSTESTAPNAPADAAVSMTADSGARVDDRDRMPLLRRPGSVIAEVVRRARPWRRSGSEQDKWSTVATAAPESGALQRALVAVAADRAAAAYGSAPPTLRGRIHRFSTASDDGDGASDGSGPYESRPSRSVEPSRAGIIAARTGDPSAPPGPDVEQLSSTPPSNVLADRFLHELAREPTISTRDLPTPFHPLASAITGSDTRVRISTDAASVRALRSVGKRAATVGDVIHLQRTPDRDARAHEVLAHELTHVAHPSPVPRFFDDDVRGPEERTAERVADIIARSPVMPSAPVPSRAGGPAASADVVRRTPASRAAGPDDVTADALAASIGGGASRRPGTVNPAGVVRRSSVTAPSAMSTGPLPADRVQRFAVDPLLDVEGDEIATEATGSDGASPFENERAEREWFDRMVAQSIDHIVRRVEDRIMIDLERRGGRHWRSF